MEYYDFDHNLSEYAEAWYDERAGELTPAEMENAADSIYLAWQDAEIGALGVSPKAYFAALGDDALIAHFLAYHSRRAIPSILMDELCARPAIAPRIAGLLKESDDEELTETCMQLLEELGDRETWPLYLEWILDPATDDDLALHASEIIQEDADSVRDALLGALEGAEDKIRDRVSDLVVYARPCEEGFRLLLERLAKGVDLPLYASYLGMYGDARAIEPLKRKAVDCDYVAFMEITNAVERLGGEMNIERDFSDDPAYQRIKKGGKHGHRPLGNG